MQKYDSYKDSGVEWIGDIPSHWIKGKWGYYFNSGMGQTILKEDLVIDGKFPVYSATEKDKIFGYINNPSLILDFGDLIIPARGNSIGHIKFVRETSTTTQTTIYSKPCNIKILSNYIYYYCKGNKNNLFPFVQTAIPQITVNEISSNPIIVPPLSEQQKIVEYLNLKTSQIDELIQKKNQKNALLKEYRSTLINQVVTKGLNPNVKMKDSGVDCIGEIPSHWEIKRVKHLIEDEGGIKIGPFGSSLKLDTLTDDGIKVYGQGNVIKNDFTIGNRHIPIERFDSDFSQYEILEGDVLITMMGTTGKSKVFKREFKKGILDSHLLRLRFKKESFLSDLFVMVLQESDYVFHQLRLNSKGSIMEGLNSSIIKELILFTAPILEQQQILLYLDEQIVKIESSIQLEKKKIELLKEYRQSLISEVVTGKIKVF
jgi:type I restriction enzyme S subunit